MQTGKCILLQVHSCRVHEPNTFHEQSVRNDLHENAIGLVQRRWKIIVYEAINRARINHVLLGQLAPITSSQVYPGELMDTCLTSSHLVIDMITQRNKLLLLLGLSN